MNCTIFPIILKLEVISRSQLILNRPHTHTRTLTQGPARLSVAKHPRDQAGHEPNFEHFQTRAIRLMASAPT